MTRQVTRRFDAPRERVYQALVSAETVARWRFPEGMTCVVHDFDGVEGGTLRISLTYEAPDRVGKASGRTDTYRGRFARLVPNELVVEIDQFESDDPAMTGEMTITIRLADAPGGVPTCSRLTRVSRRRCRRQTTRRAGGTRSTDSPSWSWGGMGPSCRSTLWVRQCTCEAGDCARLLEVPAAN